MARRFDSYSAADIEEWALRICHAVDRHQPVEDSRVELKSTWIAPEKAARRIAGHANAASGEPILWVVGADESRGVCGVESGDLAKWFAGVRAQFSQLAPSMREIVVHHQDKVVVALLFDTERAPFVVKNARFGSEQGESAELEVPWREGTGVRSARREDLIRILAPLRGAPGIEVLECGLSGSLSEFADAESFLFSFTAKLYIVPDWTSGAAVVFPNHRCRLALRTGNPDLNGASPLSIRPYQATRFVRGGQSFLQAIESSTIIEGPTELLIQGPGMLRATGELRCPTKEGFAVPNRVDVDLIIEAAEGLPRVRVPVAFEVPTEQEDQDTLRLAPTRKERKRSWTWQLDCTASALGGHDKATSQESQ